MLKMGDTVEETSFNAEMTTLQDKLSKLAIRKTGLTDNQKVFIAPSSSLARTEFKRDYPTNKIVYSISEADVIVVPDSIKYYWINSYWLFGSYNYSSGSTRNTTTVLQGTPHTKIVKEYNMRQELVATDKPIILDTFVNIKTHYGRLMTDEEIESIATMMSSRDEEMAKLGLTMLTAFDYEANEKGYVLVLARATWVKKNRVIKTLFKKIKDKYPNIRI